MTWNNGLVLSWERRAAYCHPVYLTSMQSTSCGMLDWMKHMLKSRLLREISIVWISITQIGRWHNPYGRKQRGTEEPLDESERGGWKTWIKIQYSKNKDHGIWSHHFKANRWGNNGNSDKLYFFFGGGAQKSLQMVTVAMKLKDACSLEKSYDQFRQHIKEQRHYFANKSPSIQSYGFSSSHVRMWELDHKESWALKHSCFWIVVLEKTLRGPLDCKEIKPIS